MLILYSPEPSSRFSYEVPQTGTIDVKPPTSHTGPSFPSHLFFDYKKIRVVRPLFDERITAIALNTSLCFQPCEKELAVVIGAGIAGLATALELRAHGFKVIIAEKRGGFSRSNIVNLNVPVQHFLKKFGLLKEFEECAVRIKTHTLAIIKKNGDPDLIISTGGENLPEIPEDPEDFHLLFKEDGLYSIRIKDLQEFLAKKALEIGVRMLGNVEADIVQRTPDGGVAKVQISGKGNRNCPVTFRPDLFFVTDGAHSPTAERLGIKSETSENECSNERWVFANIKAPINTTRVVSIVNTSGEILEIANVIFNAKAGEINVAVTLPKTISEHQIPALIQKTANLALTIENNGQILPSVAITPAVPRPVTIQNERRVISSMSNIVFAGDAAGHSSPLAGLGATLCLTLFATAVEGLLNDRKKQPLEMHSKYGKLVKAVTETWFDKSKLVKKFCILQFYQNNPDQGLTPKKEKE